MFCVVKLDRASSFLLLTHSPTGIHRAPSSSPSSRHQRFIVQTIAPHHPCPCPRPAPQDVPQSARKTLVEALANRATGGIGRASACEKGSK